MLHLSELEVAHRRSRNDVVSCVQKHELLRAGLLLHLVRLAPQRLIEHLLGVRHIEHGWRAPSRCLQLELFPPARPHELKTAPALHPPPSRFECSSPSQASRSRTNSLLRIFGFRNRFHSYRSDSTGSSLAA